MTKNNTKFCFDSPSSQKSEMGPTGPKSNYQQTCVPFWSILVKKLFPYYFQFLEAVYIPWLMIPSL